MADDTDETADRDKELSGQKAVREEVGKVIDAVDKGFEKQKDRAETVGDHWDAYNGKLSDRQFYNGTSQLCVPFIHDAVEARKTRFANQLFPLNGKFVEATTTDGHLPYETMALLEHYVRREKLKTQVVEPMLVNGDLEGQYSLYVGWSEHARHVTAKVKKPIEVDGMEVPEDVEPGTEDIETEEIVDAGPDIEVLSDNDVLILPATARSIEHAISLGGSVTVLRRWSKQEIKRRKKRKEITSKAADAIIASMQNNERTQRHDTSKQQASGAGIKTESGDKIAAVYEIWTEMEVGGELRLCRIYAAGKENILSVKRCPYWCDRVPVLSCAQDKVSGVFKGRSPAVDVLDFQIAANDTLNEGMDSGHFSALPIIMTDPAKNPRVESMVLAMAAIWKTDPQSTQFAKFPEMWKDCFERVLAVRSQIFQTLGVNPAMIPGTTGGKQKRNQAEIAQEQQVDLLTTASAVTVLEENILSPLLTRILEYDHQFRDRALMIRAFGELGRKAVMKEIEPQQINRRFEFRWFGVEAARNAAQMQQQIAGLNVLRGIPPQQYPGYKLNVAPAIVQMVENLFGPQIGPLIFSEEEMVSVDPMIENQMLEHGFDVPTHPGDDDMQHAQAHMQAMQQGDLHGTIRKHLIRHQQQLQQKAMQQQNTLRGPQGGGGAPGGGPQPGGQPSGPQSQAGAPGQIPPDQMAAAGAVTMPRKT